MLHIDFETRSPVDLKAAGAFNYADSPETQVLCLGYAWSGDHHPKIWTPQHGEFPADVRRYVREGGLVVAHNAQFEWLIWNRVLNIRQTLLLEQLRCSAVACRAWGLPGALADAGFALGVKQQKDKRGADLIKQCCIPPYETAPAVLAELYEYCRQDVVAEMALWEALPELSAEVWAEWRASECINIRGIRIDRGWAKRAITYADAELKEIKERIALLTNGEIETPRQYARLKKWLGLSADAPLDKRAREELLDDPELDPDARELLELTDDASRSSVAKYRAMLDRSGADDRVRGAYLFNGASTGRFSSLGLQLHNFPRKCAADADTIAEEGIPDGAGVMDTLSQMLRPTIIAAPERKLVWGDWSQIEARALPWLTGDPGTDDVLAMWADPDRDPYVEAAEGFGGSRQEGKVAVLSLGYGGGAGAFRKMGRNYGVHVEEDRANAIKTRWRASNAWAPRFWYALEEAARRAHLFPGERFDVGRVALLYLPDVLGGALFMQLPSGRVLGYPRFRIEDDESLTCVKAGRRPKADAKEWSRLTLWGGLLAENATQGTCADLLRAALRRLDRSGYCRDVIGHTHDEIILEVDETDEGAGARLRQCMLDAPEWAQGLPLGCEIEEGFYYTKK